MEKLRISRERERKKEVQKSILLETTNSIFYYIFMYTFYNIILF